MDALCRYCGHPLVLWEDGVWEHEATWYDDAVDPERPPCYCRCPLADPAGR